MTTPKIACPECGGYGSRVINTRPLARMEGVYRRRKCRECGAKFSTEEHHVVYKISPTTTCSGANS